MIRFSIIVPVFNRPEEVKELLESLAHQTHNNFEVIVVEDGSSITCAEEVKKYEDRLDISYFFKPNTGPGLSRNYGASKAKEDYFIFLDSDCIIPKHYIEILSRSVAAQKMECFGGPDRAHASFTNVQKAISYSMTSFLTTGGIRGGGKKVIKFHPRSFNMGFSRRAFEASGGFASIRFGEDIDLSLRIEELGIACHLVPEAYVYHKRRTDFGKFYKQIYNSGIARINLYKRHPGSLKLTHYFPAVFLMMSILSLVCAIFFRNPFLLWCMTGYLCLIFSDATIMYKSLKIGGLAVVSTLVQMFAYGLGFINAFVQRLLLKKGEFSAFGKNFYK